MIRFGIKIVYLQRYMTSFTDICMEKTLILQNPHWEGKPYAGLYRRQLMDNLLQKKHCPMSYVTASCFHLIICFC